jgi:hypothetical protein
VSFGKKSKRFIFGLLLTIVEFEQVAPAYNQAIIDVQLVQISDTHCRNQFKIGK